jgi:hypothetical protein
MKYEEWIKYEESRIKQPDQFAWISSAELPLQKRTTNPVSTNATNEPNQLRKNCWIVFYQRFLSRRI